jgi:hypothetical protein
MLLMMDNQLLVLKLFLKLMIVEWMPKKKKNLLKINKKKLKKRLKKKLKNC